ncbi:MAG: preprotein translocase subunit YajC [Bacteroidaceae bacterium]|nr:preprotein translocase subunit YajC [Bacteroidaceae bacterium]MBR1788083.1 preprotein translocase subunit YajC [Bacteroidaceae bacterium]
MNTMFILLQAQPQGGGISFLVTMVLIFVIMWIFMFRPQQKKQKEIQNFRNSIEVGTQVVTAGGIYGIVKAIEEAENVLVVEIARDVKIRVDRNSVYATPPATQN